jgi:hypothetical protein
MEEGMNGRMEDWKSARGVEGKSGVRPFRLMAAR